MDAECIGDTLTALYNAMGLLNGSSYIHSSETVPKDSGVTLKTVFACKYTEQHPALARLIAEFIQLVKHDEDLYDTMYASIEFNGERGDVARRVRAALATPAA